MEWNTTLWAHCQWATRVWLWLTSKQCSLVPGDAVSLRLQVLHKSLKKSLIVHFYCLAKCRIPYLLKAALLNLFGVKLFTLWHGLSKTAPCQHRAYRSGSDETCFTEYGSVFCITPIEYSDLEHVKRVGIITLSFTLHFPSIHSLLW